MLAIALALYVATLGLVIATLWLLARTGNLSHRSDRRERTANEARLQHLPQLCGWSHESASVAEFHRAFGHPIRLSPTRDVPETALRRALIREEGAELEAAVAAGDLVEVADALGDIDYVLHGAALTWGIPADPVFDAIHRSNMTKLGADGKPLYGDGVNAPLGKVLKGPGYEPPEKAITAILEAARQDAQVSA